MSTRSSVSHLASQRGLTLIELMVAVALNLVVVLVAAYLYLNGRSTEKAMEERAALFENGQLALELLGKEIGNAGYYPAHMQEPGTTLSVTRGQYTNPVPAVSAFDAGVFGCTNGYFNVKSGACAAVDGINKTGDGIVLNYFTEDALSLSAGARADCQGHIVDGDASVNTADRVGAAAKNPQLPPAHPLFVSNRYTLGKIDYAIEGGRTISTFGLSCVGNGSAKYQSLVPGIEQLRIKYGLRDASAARATQYVDAAAAGTAGPISADDQTYQGWQRVVSVQVCLVARSLTATRFRGAGAETRLDCDGNTMRDDGVQRRRFIQVFAVKNRLS
ncbi:MAG: PilW family protein [Burkholderiales bacterium]|nr:PilW family protein [Burkholderiales bacterium]